MQTSRRMRLVLIRASERALDRRPDLTVAVFRASLERTARQREGRGFESRAFMAGLTVRAMDVHPTVARHIVRMSLRRAAQQHRSPQRAARDPRRA